MNESPTRDTRRQLCRLAQSSVLVLGLALGCGGPSADSGDPSKGPRAVFDVDSRSVRFATLVVEAIPSAVYADLAERSGNDLAAHLAVWVEPESGVDAPERCPFGSPQRPPMLGSWVFTKGPDGARSAARFEPRFPFVAGVSYRVCLRGAAGESPAWSSVFGLPAPDPGQVRITEVRPAADELPANLLRIYVHFSAPMSPHNVGESIRLVAADGTVVEDAFVPIPHGLWDPDATRLSLFLHPGRVKRGVGVGGDHPVLAEGEQYELRVGTGLESVSGAVLAEQTVLAFRAGPPVRRTLDPGSALVLGPAESNDRLRLRFDRPIDAALAERLIAVRDLNGQPVKGLSRLDEGDATWTFEPIDAWWPGRYTIVIDSRLEDVAGNRSDRIFDVATPGAATPQGVAPRAPRVDGPATELYFEVLRR